MKKYNLLSLCLLFTIAVNSQSEILPQKKVQFISGVNLGFTSDLESRFGTATITNGVIFNNRISASLGVGLEASQIGEQLPIYLESRYLFFKRKSNTPFISVMGGYLQPLQRNYYEKNPGGFTAGVQIGYQNFFSEHVGIATSIGYRYLYQKSQYGYWYCDSCYYILPYEPYPIFENVSHRLELKLTLLFK